MHQQNTQSSTQDHHAGQSPDRHPGTYPTPGGNPARRVVSSVETDLFCEGCGYNLRTQKVWEEPNTKILVIQCPECSKCHAARGLGGAKLAVPDRIVQLAAIGWVLFLGLLYIGSGGFELGFLLTFSDEVGKAADRGRAFRDEYILGAFVPLILSFSIGALIIILSSSPTLNWARRMILIRSGIYLIALGFMAVDQFTSTYYGQDRALITLIVGLFLIFSQFVGGMLGVYCGRPIFMWICRNLLPANVANMIKSYWSSQLSGTPIPNPDPSAVQAAETPQATNS